MYEGTFKEGLREGKGHATSPIGDVYDGDWVNDKQSTFHINLSTSPPDYNLVSNHLFDLVWF